ncbi:hypothetical protein FB451DRAFT_1413208 [Mycena latifolia]|nr:hypothetical protein FB451DRAFT_1413208 [Mycena latifolia]
MHSTVDPDANLTFLRSLFPISYSQCGNQLHEFKSAAPVSMRLVLTEDDRDYYATLNHILLTSSYERDGGLALVLLIAGLVLFFARRKSALAPTHQRVLADRLLRAATSAAQALAVAPAVAPSAHSAPLSGFAITRRASARDHPLSPPRVARGAVQGLALDRGAPPYGPQ